MQRRQHPRLSYHRLAGKQPFRTVRSELVPDLSTNNEDEFGITIVFRSNESTRRYPPAVDFSHTLLRSMII